MNKMKNIIRYSALFLLFFHTGAQAQVMGVNTENPTRAVDVNGKVRITEAENKTNLNGVTHMLVADADGNVDKSPLPVVPLPDQSVEVFSRVILLGGTNTPSDALLPDLQVGGFIFGISDSGQPTFRRVSGSSTFIYGVKILDRRNSGTGANTNNNALEYGHSANSGDGRVYFRNFSKFVGTTATAIIDNITGTATFNSFRITNSNTGASTPITIPKNRTNTLRRRDQIRLHLVHPSEPDYFYKVTYVRVQNGGNPLGVQANGYSAPIPDNTWDGEGSATQPDIWVITVERYNNQNN